MSTTVSYKGSTLTTVDNQTKVLETAGTWLEDDITVVDESSGGEVLIVDTLDSHGGTIREITAQNTVSLQGSKAVTPTSQQQTILPDQGYDGFASVVVGAAGREDLTNPKDVDFIDYDGRLIYSYTAQEFLALSELPANPTNPGLVAQGWNWTLADAKEFVGKYGCLVIGQSYTTDNGRTKIYISFLAGAADVSSRTVTVYLTSTAAGSPTIYWGDDTSSVWTANANTTGSLAHTYQSAGDYIIEIEVTSGEISLLGQNASQRALTGMDGYVNNWVRKIEIGDDATAISFMAFGNMRNMESITIPVSVTDLSNYSDNLLTNMCKLRGIVFPKDIDTQSESTVIANCYSLVYASVPKGMHNFRTSGSLSYLRKFTMAALEPTTSTELRIKPASLDYNLTHFVVDGNYSVISGEIIRESLVKKIFIPASVTTLTGNVYQYNRYCEEVHCYPTTPPTMSTTLAFGDIGKNLSSPAIFYVPYSADHSILEAYQTATNWSTYASQMQEEPQS